jgi:hypothetical protein
MPITIRGLLTQTFGGSNNWARSVPLMQERLVAIRAAAQELRILDHILA